MALTKKQERFCQEYADGKSGAEAYRIAYDAREKSAEAVYHYAWKLRRNPAVKQRIAELQAQRKAEAEAVEKHLQRLDALREMAIEQGLVTAAIQAEIAWGKAQCVYEQMRDKLKEKKEMEKQEDKRVRIVFV